MVFMGNRVRRITAIVFFSTFIFIFLCSCSSKAAPAVSSSEVSSIEAVSSDVISSEVSSSKVISSEASSNIASSSNAISNETSSNQASSKAVSSAQKETSSVSEKTSASVPATDVLYPVYDKTTIVVADREFNLPARYCSGQWKLVSYTATGASIAYATDDTEIRLKYGVGTYTVESTFECIVADLPPYTISTTIVAEAPFTVESFFPGEDIDTGF